VKNIKSNVLKTLDGPAVDRPKKLTNGNYEYGLSFGFPVPVEPTKQHSSQPSDATIHAKTRQNADICGLSGMIMFEMTRFNFV
jgi:hypothetical protein